MTKLFSLLFFRGMWPMFFSILLAGSLLQAQPPVTTLSPQATVSVLTCSPGSELYSVFGHSALRIQDPATNLDWVWNYGVFDFKTPNFILKFAQGKLKYYVLSYGYDNFYAEYEAENRSIQEQVLDLTDTQKKAILDALIVNELPDNRYYQYDFFYDNCATRERDLLAKALGSAFRFNPPKPDDFGTYRQLIDGYLRNDVWADFGIDLALGSPTDKTADLQGAMFLPDYLFKALATAQVSIDGQWRPVIKTTHTLLAVPKPLITAFQYGPHLLGWGIFGLALLLTFLGIRTKNAWKGFDVIFYFFLGILGILFLLFWFATNHQATYANLNLLWAIPTHFLFAFSLMFPSLRGFRNRYVAVMLPFSAAFLAVSWLLPQGFHSAFIPIMMASTLRFAFMWYHNRKKAV